MKIHALLTYISRHLHTIVHMYTDTQEELICERIDFKDMLLNTGMNPELLLSTATETLPSICCVNQTIYYAVVCSSEYSFLIGPVQCHGPGALLQSIHYPVPDEWLSEVPVIDFLQLCDCTLLLHNTFSEKSLSIAELINPQISSREFEDVVQKLYGDIVFKNQETASLHNPYDQELREMNSIREGNLESLKQSWEEDFSGSYGTLGPDKLRTYKNLAIIITSLGCRAAIDGGISSEIAFSLADSYCQKIELAETPIAAGVLGRKAEFQYAGMVHELKMKKGNTDVGNSVFVQQTKDYVFSHLHGRIKVEEIARALNIHPNYLSALFRREEGRPLTQFILQEKIQLAQNMLRYSPYSYSEIANYLGFSSQSHLGKVFLKYTGRTLKQYRDCFHKRSS